MHAKKEYKNQIVDLIMQEHSKIKKDAINYFEENHLKNELCIAVENDTVVGIMTHDTHWSHGCNFLSYLYVHKDHRRQGVAKKLVEGFLKISKKNQNEKYVYSSTDVNNNASIKFHLSMGFEIAGTINNLHFGKPEIFFSYDLKKL